MEKTQTTTVLFQGDSITDADRNYKNKTDLGTGYAYLINLWFSAMHPEKNVKFLNRGIKGDRITDLNRRWQKDCLDLKPTTVSILIGINDTLGRYFWNSATSLATFENNYRNILETTKNTLNADIILMEPFLLTTKDNAKMREDLDPKVESVRKLAKEYKTQLVPLDTIFEKAAQTRDSTFWSQDGVHPTPVGHALIAQSWLRCAEENRL
jgi:acyl-CoA thioesterase I